MNIYPFHNKSFFYSQVKAKSPLRFYIYAYIRSKDSKTAKAGTPYYIGKGQSGRAFDEKRKDIPKDTRYVAILESNLTDLGALALERRYIEWYGT